MATTLSSVTLKLDDGLAFVPKTVRAYALTNFATGTSDTYKDETYGYRAMRMYVLADGVKAGSTITITLETAPTKSMAALDTVQTSSGAKSITLTSTGRTNAVFFPLDRFSRIRVNNLATGASPGASTGVFIDYELI